MFALLLVGGQSYAQFLTGKELLQRCQRVERMTSRAGNEFNSAVARMSRERDHGCTVYVAGVADRGYLCPLFLSCQGRYAVHDSIAEKM